MNFYKCKHFQPQELVDTETFNKWDKTENGIWFLFRPEALITLDNMREYFNSPITVNNWAIGGESQCRGFRPFSEPTGAKYSQHRLGNAFDCDIAGHTADEVREEILKNPDHDAFKFINCLEIGISWLHFDTRNIQKRILLVQP
jgi:hypothetical protein